MNTVPAPPLPQQHELDAPGGGGRQQPGNVDAGGEISPYIYSILVYNDLNRYTY